MQQKRKTSKLSKYNTHGLLDIDDFSWLENDRLCYYTLLYIISRHVVENKQWDYVIPSSASMRITIVKEYINGIKDDQDKIEFINTIKFAWKKIDQAKHPFKFTIDDRHDIIWTWSYIQTLISTSPIWLTNDISKYVIPTSNIERYHAIFAINDYIYVMNNEYYKTFYRKYRHFISQKKYQNTEGTTIISVRINQEYKDMVYTMAKYFNTTQSKLIETMIDNQYNKYKNKINK